MITCTEAIDNGIPTEVVWRYPSRNINLDERIDQNLTTLNASICIPPDYKCDELTIVCEYRDMQNTVRTHQYNIMQCEATETTEQQSTSTTTSSQSTKEVPNSTNSTSSHSASQRAAFIEYLIVLNIGLMKVICYLLL